MNNQPIGILDSGVGGLTIWKEIVQLLPHESTVYVGDSLRAPYGTKSNEAIYVLARKMVEFLLSKQVKAIVVACNTISVSCLDTLRAEFPHVAFIGTVPAIKTAARVTKNHHIGMLATTRTADSEYQQQLVKEFASDCVVTTVGTDELVPLIEEGEVSGLKIETVLQNVLSDFKTTNIDTLVLGCTHFPFVKGSIEKILGVRVQVLDSAEAIARQVKRILEQDKLVTDANTAKHELYTTGNITVMDLLAKKTKAGTIAKDKSAKHIDL